MDIRCATDHARKTCKTQSPNPNETRHVNNIFGVQGQLGGWHINSVTADLTWITISEQHFWCAMPFGGEQAVASSATRGLGRERSWCRMMLPQVATQWRCPCQWMRASKRQQSRSAASYRSITGRSRRCSREQGEDTSADHIFQIVIEMRLKRGPSCNEHRPGEEEECNFFAQAQ